LKQLHQLSGLLPEQVEALAVENGEKPYRGRQLFEQIHMRLAPSLSEMSVLPAAFRSRLEEQGWQAASLVVAAQETSRDGTVKLALRTGDGEVVETVLIGMEGGTFTQCMSTQVGCALECEFCATGTLGFTRNLTPAEIVDQHLVAKRLFPDSSIRNLVFMGMGEPLLNFDNLAAGVALLQAPRGQNISPRRITISTAGIIPGIEKMGRELDALLALSLNAPDQQLRARLMPVATRFPLDQLIPALEAFPLKPRRRITMEYIMLAGVNDSVAQALSLVRLLANIRCKVNLIPFNATPGCELTGSDAATIDRFAGALASKHMTVTVRQSKGADISGACGQLAGKLAAE